MATLADPLEALRQVLLTDGDLDTMVSSRIYAGELDERETHDWTPAAARKAVLLTSAGGLGGGAGARSDVHSNQIRVDVRCFGETPYQAGQVYWTAHPALKWLRRIVATNGVLLGNTAQEGGPYQLREPGTDWAYVMATWVVTFGEVAA